MDLLKEVKAIFDDADNFMKLKIIILRDIIAAETGKILKYCWIFL